MYSSLYEQLSLPVVRTVQGIVEHGSMDHSLVSSFKVQPWMLLCGCGWVGGVGWGGLSQERKWA